MQPGAGIANLITVCNHANRPDTLIGFDKVEEC